MLTGFIIVLLILIAVMLYRTYAFTKNKSPMNGTSKELEPLKNCHEKLSGAIKIPTISNSDYSQTDFSTFEAFQSYLEKCFPLVHQHMTVERINTYSLLYHWKGKNSDLKPCLTTAHIDVVPVEEGTDADWEHPAFSGTIDEEYVWGRGTLDIKSHLITSLEAAERLLEEGFTPARDHYFAFGHDEEVGGTKGAAHIVETLKKRGLTFEYLIDEGGSVIEGFISSIKKPIAAVGIAEKGYANIKVEVSHHGGHASMPSPHTSLGLIGSVMANLEKKQSKLRLITPIRDFLYSIGPYMGFATRFMLANLWLTKPLFKRIFAKMSTTGNAMLRTTTAITMAKGSMEPNVLPQTASMTGNFRVLTGETCQDLIEHIRTVNKNIDLNIVPLRLEDPSTISPTDTHGYHLIKEVTEKLYGNIIVTPYLVMAGTDARKYEPICDNIYRFTPYLLNSEELGKIHSTNERISHINIRRCITFFMDLYRID